MHRTLVLLATVALLGACASAADDPVPATTALATEPAAEATVPARPLQFEQPPSMQIDPAADYVAEIVTSEGPIVIDLFEDTAPSTVNNFVFLARQGYYNGVIFHRVIPGFMIQGGDPTGSGRGGPGYTFPDELNSPLPYARGIVAMANAGPNTNGSQFFIMHSDYGLPYSYSIFGNVIEGLDTVDAIAGTELSGERPVKDVVIEEITITGP